MAARHLFAPLMAAPASAGWHSLSTRAAPAGRKALAALCAPKPPRGWEWGGVAQKRPMSTAAAAVAEEAPAAGVEIQKAEAKPKRAPRVPRKKRDVMTVSETAAKRIRELVEAKDPQPHGIRLGVRTRGCNGLSYTLNYVDEPPKLDDCVEADGVKVYVDPKAVMYLVGARMDFVEDAVKAEFVFENPNAKGACGCGESFNV